MTSSFLIFFALQGCESQSQTALVPRPTTGTVTGTGTSTGSTTGVTTTLATGDTGIEPEEIDCSILPPMPANYQTLTGYSTAEDFDFNGAGYVVAVVSSNLSAKDQAGDIQIISPGVGNWTSGTRTLATGDYVVAVPGDGTLVLVDGVTGGQVVITGGLSYPNGVEVDSQNNVYYADQTTAVLGRINAYDNTDYEVIATGVSGGNGVILSPDEQTIYVGSFTAGKIWAVDRDPSGVGWLDKRVIFESPGWDSGYDGINVDACGNVYWTEYISGKVRRITPDGVQVDLVANLPSSWIPNMRWGNDIGGWDNGLLYVSDRDQGRLFALDVGIPGKKHLTNP